MGAVQISGTFSKDEKAFNGLEAIAKELIEEPLTEHYIIAKVQCIRITTDVADGGSEIPTVRLKHIEVMLSDKEELAARKLFEQACKARLGELPQQTLFEDAPSDEPSS